MLVVPGLRRRLSFISIVEHGFSITSLPKFLWPISSGLSLNSLA